MAGAAIPLFAWGIEDEDDDEDEDDWETQRAVPKSRGQTRPRAAMLAASSLRPMACGLRPAVPGSRGPSGM